MEAQSSTRGGDVAEDDEVALQTDEKAAAVWGRDLAEVDGRVGDDHAAAETGDVSAD